MMIEADKVQVIQLAVKKLRKVYAKGKRFSISTWYEEGEPDGYLDCDTCGTVACAAGWLAHDREFRKASGLKLKGNPFDNNKVPAYNRPDGIVVDGLSAVQDVFHMDWRTSDAIFTSSGYDKPSVDITANDVADMLEAYLADPEEPNRRAQVKEKRRDAARGISVSVGQRF